MGSMRLILLLTLVSVAGQAHASGGCELTLRPATSGFFLNPTIDKVTVVEASSTDPESPCGLMANDEIVQINDQVVPGRKAKEVMKYWKAIPKKEPRVFSVIRNGEATSVVVN